MSVAAYTKRDPIYPGYVNVTRNDDGSISITVRGDPSIRQGVYVCGYRERDQGKHGRCTPGDEHCNNYCNLAAHKGPMADRPLPCNQTSEGPTALVRLSTEEWAGLLKLAKSL